MKLLIADDNLDVVNMLESYFSVRGFEVQTVRDGLECLTVAQTFKPNFILLDIKMKRIDGDKVMVDLLALCPDAKILVVTGSQDEALKNKVLKLGAHYYFEKPVSLVHILQTIRAIQEEVYVEKR